MSMIYQDVDAKTLAAEAAQDDITDAACYAAIAALNASRIEGYSYSGKHFVRDVDLPPGKQLIWTGSSILDLKAQVSLARMRKALKAAISHDNAVVTV